MVSNNNNDNKSFQVGVRLPKIYFEHIVDLVETGKESNKSSYVRRVIMNKIDEERKEEATC